MSEPKIGVMDAVFQVCREEIEAALRPARARIKARVEALIPGSRVETDPLHSGKDVFCSAFGKTDDLGVLGSHVLGLVAKVTRDGTVDAGDDATLREFALSVVRSVVSPENRALISCALVDFRWNALPKTPPPDNSPPKKSPVLPKPAPPTRK